uniref:DUF4806 domain-containing protein n=1 Tax=Anopheles funestus TaxID=62324 RepID=A0A4Y0BDR1_ANOFN
MPSKILHKLNGTAGQNDFHLDNLKTVEDVNRFEDQLRNEQYWKKIQTFVDCTIHYETRPMKRMKLMFDRLFDRQLLPQLNWSGKFGKNPFKYYFNIRNLFEYIGTTPTHHSNGVEVTKFFINTLQYVVRVPSTVASSGNNIDTTQKETIPNVQVEAAAQNDTMEQSKQIRQDEMIEEDERHEPEESMEHDESALDEGQTLSEVESVANASENSFVEKHVNRITCVEELDTLENQLNDLKVKQHLHRWIEETVGLEANVEKRMSVLLDQLMDRKVLQTFSWVDENSEKRPLQRYQNFVKLFEYASRTMIHQTIVYNHRYVSNFFTNCIKEQCST